MIATLRRLASLLLLLGLLPSAHAQLERTYAAHGGLPIWQSFRWVEYDLNWQSSKGIRSERHTFDLRTRDGLIKSAPYMLGAEKGAVWITPNAEALGGTPPRFYMWTAFYFFGMPFVFADSGARHEALGMKTVGGVEYDAVRISFQPGTGDSSDDSYVAYLERPSGQLKIVSYVVTYPALRKGKPIEQLEQHAIVFEEWQAVNDLSVPKLARLFAWKNENIEGEAAGSLEFSNVRFSADAPEPDRFKKPENAIVVPRE